MKQITVLLVLFFLLAGCGRGIESEGVHGPDGVQADAQVEIGQIDGELEKQIESLAIESGIPSLAVGMVVDDELIWAKGYGEQPELSTVYMAGSIDKALIATAVLQLYEQGVIDLDDDINEYLPFEVRHPDYPEVPVTIRMLLTHTAGLAHDLPGSRYTDSDGPMLRWLFWNRGYRWGDLQNSFSEKSTEELLQDVFVHGLFADDSTIWIAKPGEKYQYSNAGFKQLLGYVVEQVTGQPINDTIEENILDPLDMEDTSFEAADLPQERLAIPYVRTEDGYQKLPVTGMSASNKLRTTVSDLARFNMLHMNRGELDGVRILEPETMDLMHERTIPLHGFDFPSMELYGMGLGWQLWEDGLQGHGGAVPGFYAQMLNKGDGEGSNGVVLMMNTGCSLVECDFEWFDAYFVAIRELLLQEAASRSQES